MAKSLNEEAKNADLASEEANSEQLAQLSKSIKSNGNASNPKPGPNEKKAEQTPE